MRRSSLIGPVGALIILACAAPHACACLCAGSDFYGAFAGSNAVFLGEVLDISSPGSEYPGLVSVMIRVETAWKGAPASTATKVVTAANSAFCGFGFRVGARYLVYAHRPDVPPASGELWASLCSRTHETWPGDPDLALLGSPIPFLSVTVSPNPCLQWARLAWTIQGDAGRTTHARLEVLDFQGRRIQRLVDGPTATGAHESYWDGRNEHGDLAPAGIYWLRLTSGDRVTTRRLVRLASGP
jgi:hypothetical protein